MATPEKIGLTHAYVHHVANSPNTVKRDRRLVVIHEMWRKFQLRNEIKNYQPWQWWFDESEGLDELTDLS